MPTAANIGMSAKRQRGAHTLRSSSGQQIAPVLRRGSDAKSKLNAPVRIHIQHSCCARREASIEVLGALDDNEPLLARSHANGPSNKAGEKACILRETEDNQWFLLPGRPRCRRSSPGRSPVTRRAFLRISRQPTTVASTSSGAPELAPALPPIRSDNRSPRPALNANSTATGSQIGPRLQARDACCQNFSQHESGIAGRTADRDCRRYPPPPSGQLGWMRSRALPQPTLDWGPHAPRSATSLRPRSADDRIDGHAAFRDCTRQPWCPDSHRHPEETRARSRSRVSRDARSTARISSMSCRMRGWGGVVQIDLTAIEDRVSNRLSTHDLVEADIGEPASG